jgi:hypothetical protein
MHYRQNWFSIFLVTFSFQISYKMFNFCVDWKTKIALLLNKFNTALYGKNINKIILLETWTIWYQTWLECKLFSSLSSLTRRDNEVHVSWLSQWWLKSVLFSNHVSWLSQWWLKSVLFSNNKILVRYLAATAHNFESLGWSIQSCSLLLNFNLWNNVNSFNLSQLSYVQPMI